MIEAGHEARTLLDTLSLRAEDESIGGDEAAVQTAVPPTPQPRLRIVAHGLIIGHLLRHIADPEAAESPDARPGLSRHYFEV